MGTPLFPGNIFARKCLASSLPLGVPQQEAAKHKKNATLQLPRLSFNKKTMKRTSLLFTVVIMLTVFSCKKQPAVNENYVPVTQCKTFTRSSGTITCCLDSVIQDSRCPINAACIWEGIGVARFTIKFKNENHVITLATQKFSTLYSKDTTLVGFNIELVNLFPYPADLNKRGNYNNYIAELNIVQR